MQFKWKSILFSFTLITPVSFAIQNWDDVVAGLSWDNVSVNSNGSVEGWTSNQMASNTVIGAATALAFQYGNGSGNTAEFQVTVHYISIFGRQSTQVYFCVDDGVTHCSP